MPKAISILFGALFTVATAYAATGLLLRAIGVCKRILELDPRHHATQELLAKLYGKPERPRFNWSRT